MNLKEALIKSLKEPKPCTEHNLYVIEIEPTQTEYGLRYEVCRRPSCVYESARIKYPTVTGEHNEQV